MEIFLLVFVVAFIAVLIFRKGEVASPPPKATWEPEVTIAITDDRTRYSEHRVAELLRQLDEPYGYWTYANVPPRLEEEMRQLLAIDPTNRIATALKERLPRLKRECATKMVLMRVQDLSDRAELAATVATKQKNAREALSTIDAALTDGVADPAPLLEKVPVLRRYVAQVEIDGFTEKAKRFEFKGNLKKALEYYQDALYSAIHDDIDDADQQESIRELTAKVEEMMAGITQEAVEKKAIKKKPGAPAALDT